MPRPCAGAITYQSTMYIKKIELQNFQVIKDFAADFNGGVYLVTGDNELGKSTLLKAIGALLTGDRDAVLRNGEKKGFARMVVGDDGEEFEVALSFTEANPRGTLSIKQKSTGIKSNNLSMLQQLIGYQDFDAVEFSRWSETAEGRRKQVQVIKSLLPEETRAAIDRIDEQVAKVREARLEKGREVNTFGGFVATIKGRLQPGDEKTYAQPVDMTEILHRQEAAIKAKERAKSIETLLGQRRVELAATDREKEDAAQRKEARVLAAQNAVKAAAQALEDARARLAAEVKDADAEYKASIERLEAQKEDLKRRINNGEEWLAAYRESGAEEEDIDTAIAEAEEHNKRYHTVAQYLEKKTQYDTMAAELKEIERRLEGLLNERKALVESSPLPVSGLSFSEEGLWLNDVPFVPGKVSDSQTMEIATKLVIAANPKVKVFRIARGESLGAKRLATIVDFARKNGYQGFIENVVRGQEEMRVEEYTEV